MRTVEPTAIGNRLQGALADPQASELEMKYFIITSLRDQLADARVRIADYRVQVTEASGTNMRHCEGIQQLLDELSTEKI